jgi:uncharacterized protein YegP (UPF0339 family)
VHVATGNLPIPALQVRSVTMKFVIKSAVQGQSGLIYWFVVVADNGEIVAASETYPQKRNAVDTIAALRSSINQDTPVEDTTIAAPRSAAG